MPPKWRDPDEGVTEAQKRQREYERWAYEQFKYAFRSLIINARVPLFDIARMCSVRVSTVSVWKRASERITGHYDLPDPARCVVLTDMFIAECAARGVEVGREPPP